MPDRTIAHSGAPIRGDTGDILGVVLVFRDQTAEREAERRLRESEARYRRIVETTSQGIVTLDAGSVITFANSRIAEILGTTPEEMLGKGILETLSPESRQESERGSSAGLWGSRRTTRPGSEAGTAPSVGSPSPGHPSSRTGGTRGRSPWSPTSPSATRPGRR